MTISCIVHFLTDAGATLIAPQGLYFQVPPRGGEFIHFKGNKYVIANVVHELDHGGTIIVNAVKQ